MTEQAGYDWTGLWQAWGRVASGAWAEALRGNGASPLEDAVARFQRFADDIAAVLGGVTPAAQAAQLAAACERLAAAWDGHDQAQWFAAPFALGAAGVDDSALRGLLAASDTADAWSRELLGLPVLGPQREWQAAGRRLVEAGLAERAAQRHLLAHHVAATRSALRAFAAFLRDEDGPPLTTLRAVYDAWIGIADEAWRATLMSADYGRDFGAWVNRVSALRQAWSALDERVAALDGRPTRAAFEALLARQEALAAELERLRAVPADPPAMVVDEQPATPPREARAAPAAARPARQRPAAGAKSTPPARAAKPRNAPGTRRAARKSATRAAEFDITSILEGGD